MYMYVYLVLYERVFMDKMIDYLWKKIFFKKYSMFYFLQVLLEAQSVMDCNFVKLI